LDIGAFKINKGDDMSMFNDAVTDNFVIYNTAGEQVASGLKQTLELINKIDSAYSVSGNADNFEIISNKDGLVASDINALLELIDDCGYRVAWEDDRAEHTDIDEDYSIKEYLADIGISV
jgi:hypothetical protein